MATRKRYYEDCHLSSFTAQVVSCVPTEKGWQIILSETAFYPEGGGQACDTGTLGGARVLDVRERGEAVVHLCDSPLEPGSTVTGEIDYQRRFELMQQHTGEHIVSGIIHSRWGYHNVGFHMGSELVTIDFDGPIPAEELPWIEEQANRAVWQDLPLHIWYPSPEELPNVGYRSKRELPWPVRVVEVPGFDKCACCGVHVARTGEVGLVKLFSVVKFHQGVRIEMACGKRALDHLSAVYVQNKQVSQAFSTKILETGAAARKMNELLAAEKYRVVGLQRQVFAAIAQECVERGNVVRFEEGLDNAGLRDLTDGIAQVCGGIAAVFTGSDESGYSFCLAQRQGDLRQLCREMTGALSGRGGGKPEFVQGSLRATKEEILSFFRSKGIAC